VKILALLSLFFISNAFAYKMTIYTDQPDQKSANDVLSTFKKTYPFNQFEIDLEIKVVKPEDLKCAPMHGIARLLGCDSLNIAADAGKRGVDQALIIKNSPQYGGSGGAIPVMSSSSPPSTIIHEYLHTLGLCDEYEYSVREADYYCSVGGANMVLIAPDPKGYFSDADARAKHMGQIPWSSLIKSTTPISRPPSLGTGIVNHSVYAIPNTASEPNKLNSAVGLYEGKTCKNAVLSKNISWQPGGEASIMEFLDAGLGSANEQIVAKILESKGVRRKASVGRADAGIYDSRSPVNKSDYGSDSNSSYSRTISR
jgi:hypothetical protein